MGKHLHSNTSIALLSSPGSTHRRCPRTRGTQRWEGGRLQLLRLWSGAALESELVFFLFAESLEAPLWLGVEVSPVFLHKARKRVTSFCLFRGSKAQR